jgi:hypothetical protein
MRALNPTESAGDQISSGRLSEKRKREGKRNPSTLEPAFGFAGEITQSVLRAKNHLEQGNPSVRCISGCLKSNETLHPTCSRRKVLTVTGYLQVEGRDRYCGRQEPSGQGEPAADAVSVAAENRSGGEGGRGEGGGGRPARRHHAVPQGRDAGEGGGCGRPQSDFRVSGGRPLKGVE